jgi:hypothetical protein
VGIKQYKCYLCEKSFERDQVVVDHVQPVVEPKKGFTTWDQFIERLFCDASNLKACCSPCHKIKTQKEEEERKKYGTGRYSKVSLEKISKSQKENKIRREGK